MLPSLTRARAGAKADGARAKANDGARSRAGVISRNILEAANEDSEITNLVHLLSSTALAEAKLLCLHLIVSPRIGHRQPRKPMNIVTTVSSYYHI